MKIVRSSQIKCAQNKLIGFRKSWNQDWDQVQSNDWNDTFCKIFETSNLSKLKHFSSEKLRFKIQGSYNGPMVQM